MIVPRNRLLIWFAIVALPFSVLAGAYPSALAVSLLFVAALLLLAGADAFLSRASLRGICLTAPALTRLALERDGEIELRVQNASCQPRRLRLALCMLEKFSMPDEELEVDLPGGAEWSKLTWPCRPGKRGNYRLESAHLEAASPLGFWSARRAVPLSSEIRVYPNLRSERKGLTLMFRGGLGMHVQRQVGKGREFEKLRDYVPGDGSEDIHWKATARRGRPVTKVFQIERTQEVYVAIDASRLSAREDAIEHQITTALLLGVAAEEQGDLFGLITFSDRVEKFVRARGGKSHYHDCREAIYALEPREVNPDFNDVSSFIRLHLRRRALVVFLTALDDPLLSESFVRNVDMIARQHLVLVNMVKPPGIAPIFSGGEVNDIDDLYTQLGGHFRWHNLEEVGKLLQRRGVKFSAGEGGRMGLNLVSEYLAVKRRQLL